MVLTPALIVLVFAVFQIDKQQFEETVRTLNNLYAEAEKLGSQSFIEGCLACLTAYTVFLCMETHYEKVRHCALLIVGPQLSHSEESLKGNMKTFTSIESCVGTWLVSKKKELSC